jgi:hypothetical protein
MRRRFRPQPEVPWWLRPLDSHDSSAPPLPPKAISSLQEEEQRRYAHMKAAHEKYVLQTQLSESAPLVENAANDAHAAGPPEPATSTAPVVTSQSPPAATPGTAPPQPEPPPISQTLDAVAEFIRKHLVCSDHQRTVLVLWIVHTYCYDYFPVTPYLNIFSPEKQSGKSLCLQLLNILCCKPWMLAPGGITKSGIMKGVAGSQPALLLDDWHTVFHASSFSAAEAQPIIGFLNAGSTGGHRDAYSPGNERFEDDRFEIFDHNDVRPISTPRIYCPKAFAGPGDLPLSLADRCVPIALKRKKPSERTEFFWLDLTGPMADPLVEPLPAWVKNNWEPLRVTACDLLSAPFPDFSMRQHGFVVPLLAIAEVVGGQWPRKARTALQKIFNAAPDEPPTVGLQLLSDIRDFFIQEHDPPSIHSEPLLRYLNLLEDRPWKTPAKQLTPNRLRNILKYFSIARTSAQEIGGKNLRGFTFRHFSDSWQRYLPHLPPRRPGTKNATGNNPQPGPQLLTSEPQSVTNALGVKMNGLGLTDLGMADLEMNELGANQVQGSAPQVNASGLNNSELNDSGINDRGLHLQDVTSQSQAVTNDLQGVRKPTQGVRNSSQGVRNNPQGVRNFQPCTNNPNVFNALPDVPAHTTPIQPQKNSGDHKCSTTQTAIPDP